MAEGRAVKDHVNFIATVIGVVVTLVTIICTFANAFDRVGRHQVVIEDHETRIDAIERDETVKEKLQKLKESTDYLGWRLDALTKELEKGKKR